MERERDRERERRRGGEEISFSLLPMAPIPTHPPGPAPLRRAPARVHAWKNHSRSMTWTSCEDRVRWASCRASTGTATNMATLLTTMMSVAQRFTCAAK